jgi:hypothetical protein
VSKTFERLALRETSSPDGNRWWLVQYAVNGIPCMPFYEPEARRREAGWSDEEWFRHLEEQAESSLESYGMAPALGR